MTVNRGINKLARRLLVEHKRNAMFQDKKEENMEKNTVLKELEKEIRVQEKLKQQISEKRDLLKDAKEKEVTYRKWLKKLDRLEQAQLRRKKEIDARMNEKLQPKWQLSGEEKKPEEADGNERESDYSEGLFRLGDHTYE